MIDRRLFLRGALAGPALAASGSWTDSLAADASRAAEQVPLQVSTARVPAAVATLVNEQNSLYVRAMNAPGMVFTLTSLADEELTAAYGWENPESRVALSPDRLFQIGSISKSMAAVLILQLVDEGKLRLDRPVMEYLPWLPWHTPFGAVTLHHVLTHTSGLPSGGALSFARGDWVHEQRYAPGERYFYSNMAFNTLGDLVELCDGRSYQEALRARLLLPLGMVRSLPAIGGAGWSQQATSYIPADPDRPYLRFAPLRQAPAFHEQTSAGCVVSSAAEMARYLRFLLRGGVAERGQRLLSADSFGRMTTRWIGAAEFGRTAGYGYGIAVDQQDGEKVLLHTGGMVSFMSSIYLNTTRGMAAFASINAQQGYRPRPVTRFAVQALRAATLQQPLPAAVAVADDRVMPHAEQLRGRYADGNRTVDVEPTRLPGGTGLLLRSNGRQGLMQGEGDVLQVDDALLGLEPWGFLRDKEGKVTGLTHGGELYLRSGATPLPAAAPAPSAWQAYCGHYVNDDPWVGSSIVVQRQGALYLDEARLTPREDGSFFVENEADSADRVAFAAEVNGRAEILLLNGTALRRFRPWPQAGGVL